MRKISWYEKNDWNYSFNDADFTINISFNPSSKLWNATIDIKKHNQDVNMDEHNLKQIKLNCENYIHDHDASIENKICLNILNRFILSIFKTNIVWTFMDIQNFYVEWFKHKKLLKIYDRVIGEKYLSCDDEEGEWLFKPFLTLNEEQFHILNMFSYSIYEVPNLSLSDMLDTLKTFNAKICNR